MNTSITYDLTKGIAQSPYVGCAYSQNIDYTSFPGGLRAGLATEALSVDFDNSHTFTVDVGGDFIITSSTSNWETGTTVEFTTTGTLPSGLSTGTLYYLRKFSATTFQVHPTFNDAIFNTNEIDITDSGTGTHTATTFEISEIIKIKGDYFFDDNGSLWSYNSANDVFALLSKGSGSGVGMDIYGGRVYMFRNSRIDYYTISSGVTTNSFQTDTGGVSLVGRDDILYIGSGNDVRSINGTTYNSSALDLPDGDSINCMCEAGIYLVIGTNKNRVYFWDRVSSSFELSALLPYEPKILAQFGNAPYAILENGDIYTISGSVTQLVKQFPEYILDRSTNPSFVFSPDGYSVRDRSIYIGFGSTSTTSPIGVYEYNVDTGEFRIAHTASNGYIGGASATKMQYTAIQNIGTFYIAYNNANAYGVDKVSIENRYQTATFYTKMSIVGTENKKGIIKGVNMQLAEQLRGGQSITVYYRTDTAGTFVEYGTFTEQGNTYKTINKSIDNLLQIQFKIEITTNQDSYSPTVVMFEAV